MKISKVLYKILGIKPMTLQQGLNHVKKRMGAIGENLSQKPGERIYKTCEGDKIVIRTSPLGINVERIIDKNNLKYDYNSYVGRIVGIKIEHYNRKLNDIWRRFQSLTTISIIKPKNTPVLDRSVMPGESVVRKFHDGSIREYTKICHKCNDYNLKTGLKI